MPQQDPNTFWPQDRSTRDAVPPTDEPQWYVPLPPVAPGAEESSTEEHGSAAPTDEPRSGPPQAPQSAPPTPPGPQPSPVAYGHQPGLPVYGPQSASPAYGPQSAPPAYGPQSAPPAYPQHSGPPAWTPPAPPLPNPPPIPAWGQAGQPPPFYPPGTPQPVNGGNGGRSRAVLGSLVAGAVVLVLAIVGVVVWRFSGRDEPKAPIADGGSTRDATPGVLDVAWTAPYGAAGEEADRSRTTGGWVTDTAVVRLRGNGAVAYGVEDGKQLWTATVPAGAVTCSSSPTAEGGIAALVYGVDRKCDQVGLLNLADGKLSPPTRLDGSGRAGTLSAPGVIVVPGTAIVASSRSVTAINLADGKTRWTAFAARLCFFGESVVSDGEHVVASSDCLRNQVLLSFALADGAKRFEEKQPDGLRVHALLAVKPVVMVTSKKIGADRELAVLDDNGKITKSIPTRFDDVKLSVSSIGGLVAGANRIPVGVRDNVLYAANDAVNGKATEKDQIVAIDLATGQRKWGSTGNAGRANLIRVDEKGVLALESYHRGARLVTVDLATGKTSPVASGEFELFALPSSALTIERGGTLVMMSYSRLDLGAGRDDKAVTVLR